jgi:hypothetical protein
MNKREGKTVENNLTPKRTDLAPKRTIPRTQEPIDMVDSEWFKAHFYQLDLLQGFQRSKNTLIPVAHVMRRLIKKIISVRV